MQVLADRIRAVRKKLGINQQELADILGASDGKVKGWEQGKTITMKPRDIILLSNKYGFNPKWLEDGMGEMMQDKGELLLHDMAVTEALLSNAVAIPYFKDINASAGHGCVNGECDPSYIKLSEDMIKWTSKNTEAIKASGNSMHPTIEDGDIIFIDKSDVSPENGKIYVIFLCDEVYVKRIFLDPVTKSVLLKSDNPVFPEFKADCEDFKIIGRVVANMQISKL